MIFIFFWFNSNLWKNYFIELSSELGAPILEQGQKNFWDFSIRSFKFLDSRLVSFRCIPVYGLLQYYESKVLHNTEVAWFSTEHHSLKITSLIQTVKKHRSPVQSASFDTFKTEISLLFTPQSKFWFSQQLRFWSKMIQNSISQGTLKTDFGVHNRPKFLLQMC